MIISGAITLGVKFKADFDGTISGIRFFKAPLDNATTDEHVTLYALSPDGEWPMVRFWFRPVCQRILYTTRQTENGQRFHFRLHFTITANTVYVATYYSPTGYYNATQ